MVWFALFAAYWALGVAIMVAIVAEIPIAEPIPAWHFWLCTLIWPYILWRGV